MVHGTWGGGDPGGFTQGESSMAVNSPCSELGGPFLSFYWGVVTWFSLYLV